jgi:putative ABC transport system permease protein
MFAGAMLATTAAARRTDTAYDRLLAVSHPYDQFLLGGDLGEIGADVTPEGLRTIPQVADVMDVSFFPYTQGEALGSADPRYDHTFNRAKVVEGRLPDPNSVDEISVPVAIRERLHVHAGSRITLRFYKPPVGDGPPQEVPLTMTVAGVVAAPGEFPPESDLGPPRIHITQGFIRANRGTLANDPAMLVWLHHGPADLKAFRASLTEKYKGKAVVGFAQSALTKNVNRAFHLQAVSLELFAAALAIVTLLVLGQALGRQALTEGVDYPSLRALGMTRRQLFSLGAMRATLIAAAGVALAVPIAFLLSPLAPTGLARAAEPHPGFAFDITALLVGAIVVLAVLLLLALIPIVRAARAASSAEQRDARAERASRSAVFASRAGARPPALVGIRLALEPGRGRTAVPVRTTIVGVALAVAAVVLSLGFAASLRHLLDTPRLYGVSWSALVRFEDDDTTNQRSDKAIALARKDPDVVAVGNSGLGIPLFIGDVQADAYMLPKNDRTFYPAIQAGRAPAGRGEILLGPKTLQRIHRHVGDTIGVGTVGVVPQPMRIVGSAVVPTVGHTANLGEGAMITFDSVYVFVPGVTADMIPRDEFLVRLRPEANAPAALARLQKSLDGLGAEVELPSKPADLLNFGRNKNLPYILSGMLAALALATLAHAIFSTVTRRRRDLAILKTLGFTRGDTRSTVAWQSTTFVVISLVLGIGTGAVAGRWLWTVYANGLGVLAEPRVPLGVDLAIVPIGLLIANALTLIPARSAARTRPALVLRTE